MPVGTTGSGATWPARWAHAPPASRLAQVETGMGTFIAYSTQPGNVALDGSGRSSPFTAAFARNVKEPGRNITAVMIEVRKEGHGRQAGALGSFCPDGSFFTSTRLRLPAPCPKSPPPVPSADAEAVERQDATRTDKQTRDGGWYRTADGGCGSEVTMRARTPTLRRRPRNGSAAAPWRARIFRVRPALTL
jgi:hypothetical protein